MCHCPSHGDRPLTRRQALYALGMGMVGAMGQWAWGRAIAAEPPEHLRRLMSDKAPVAPANTISPPSGNTRGASASALPDSLWQGAEIVPQRLSNTTPLGNFGNLGSSEPSPTAVSASSTPSYSAIANPSDYPPFQIISVHGEVNINGRMARAGQTIQAGDTLRTYNNGSLIYRWWDEIIKLYPLSIMLHGQDASQWGTIEGRILVASKGSVAPRVVHSQQMALQMHHTTFYMDTRQVAYDQYGQTVPIAYVCVCIGQATIARAQNPQDQMTLNNTYHNAPQRISPRQFIATPEVMGHQDDEIILLQSYLKHI